ncbi:MAG: hypothetical protein KDD69_18885, partial [Bdellovibrionales bacterium]|nr:hypothetical protein [Bdellovibrionales bacterium]
MNARRQIGPLLLAVLVLGSGAVADDLAPGEIRLDGLTFFCPSCRERADSFCEYETHGESIRLSCDELLVILLDRATEATQALPAPRATELSRFAVRHLEDDALLKPALLLLLKSREGEDELRRWLDVLERERPEVLGMLAALGSRDPDLWQRLYAQGNTHGDRAAERERRPDIDNEAAPRSAKVAHEPP